MEPVGHRLEHAESFGFRVGDDRWRQVVDVPGQFRKQSHQLAAGRAESPWKRPAGLGLDVREQQFGKRLIRNVEVLVVAAVEDGGAGLVHPVRKLRDESGLPDAGLAVDRRDLDLAVARPPPGVGQCLPLDGSADETEAVVAVQASREFGNGVIAFPRELPRDHLVVETLERHRSRIGERELGIAPGEFANEVRDQYASVVRCVAQPRRLDDRHAEEVIGIDGDIAGSDSDAQQDRLVEVRTDPIQLGLHADGAHQRTGRRRERCHQPVAQVFDDDTTVRRDQVGLHRVDSDSGFLRAPFAEPLTLRRGVDDVGEHDDGEASRRSLRAGHHRYCTLSANRTIAWRRGPRGHESAD